MVEPDRSKESSEVGCWILGFIPVGAFIGFFAGLVLLPRDFAANNSYGFGALGNGLWGVLSGAIIGGFAGWVIGDKRRR